MNKILIIGLMLFSHIAVANGVKIVDVKLMNKGGQSYRVDVTLLHEDTGWDHYADGWKILDENKILIGTRTLHHPHESEQPFTRSLYSVNIKAGSRFIYIQAHDKVHGDSELHKINIIEK